VPVYASVYWHYLRGKFHNGYSFTCICDSCGEDLPRLPNTCCPQTAITAYCALLRMSKHNNRGFELDVHQRTPQRKLRDLSSLLILINLFIKYVHLFTRHELVAHVSKWQAYFYDGARSGYDLCRGLTERIRRACPSQRRALQIDYGKARQKAQHFIY
jgi:hypothetical protein